MSSLELLLGWPWFSRVWTVQEVVLARRAVIRAEGVEIDWRAVEEACGVAIDLNMMDQMDFVTTVTIAALRTGEHTTTHHVDCASNSNRRVHVGEDGMVRDL